MMSCKKYVLAITMAALFSAPAYSDAVITAAGDYGNTLNTKDVLKRIAKISPDIHFALGDFSYGQMTETAWCNMVHESVKTPVLLVPGNHDIADKDSNLQKFIECMPYSYTQPITGEYAKEYFVDIPQPTPPDLPPDAPPPPPLARLIMIAPNLTIDGNDYSYVPGNPHYDWLMGAINQAKELGARWIIVGMHKVCINTETKECEIGETLANALIDARVDVVLSGHIHAYERSWPLSCMRANRFDAMCAPNRQGFIFKRGKGTIFTSIGTGGTLLRETNSNDPEMSYFAKVFSANEGNYYGVGQLSISRKELRMQFIEAKTGYILDEFLLKR